MIDDNQMPLPDGYQLKHYKILEKLNKGGFGIAYLALDTIENKPVVIKEYFPDFLAHRTSKNTQVSVLSSEKSDDYQQGLRRFEREALVLGEFHHANIVKVLSMFKDNNTAYFVMDFIDGQSLKDYQQSKNRPLTEQEIIQQCLPVLKGLEEVHKKGLLHLDIKPENILKTKHGEPMLIDFGGARFSTGKASQEHSSMVATEGYAPPEQYTRTAEQSPATDIYAFGMTLYNLMAPAAMLPLSQDRQTALVEDSPDPLRPIRSIAKGYSETLYQAVEACTQIRQKNRPKTVQTLQDILAPLFEPGGDSKPAPQVITGNSDKTILTTNSQKQDPIKPVTTDKKTSSKKSFKVMLVITLLLGLIGGGYQYNQSQQKSEAETFAEDKRVQEEVRRIAEQKRIAEERRALAEAKLKAEEKRALAVVGEQISERQANRIPPAPKNINIPASSATEQKQKHDAQLAYAKKFPGQLKKGLVVTKDGLMWMRCSLGQTWTGSTCKGEVETYNWDQAIEISNRTHYEGYGDWRLPTLQELHSLVYCSEGRKAVEIDGKGRLKSEGDCLVFNLGRETTINQDLFPNANSWFYWSSPFYPYKSENGARGVQFIGTDFTNFRSYDFNVRLVRGTNLDQAAESLVGEQNGVQTQIHRGWFEADRAEVKSRNYASIMVYVERLFEQPDSTIRIKGYTDSKGNLAYNLALAERRANAVKDVFIAEGISSRRIETISYGEGEPVASNDTEEGRALNRRIEIEFYPDGR